MAEKANPMMIQDKTVVDFTKDGKPILDGSVISHFPDGATVQFAKETLAREHGRSSSGIAVRVAVALADGTESHYSLMCATEDSAQMKTRREFQTLREIHKVSPTLVSEPINHGQFIYS